MNYKLTLHIYCNTKPSASLQSRKEATSNFETTLQIILKIK